MKIVTGTKEKKDQRRKSSMAKGIVEINDRTFDSWVLQSDKPVLVDFWAPWSGPCKSIGPVVEKLAQTFFSQFCFAKCNVDNNPNISEKLGIRGVPTLMFFKGGNLVDKLIGMVPKSIVEDAIRRCLSGSEPIGPHAAQ